MNYREDDAYYQQKPPEQCYIAWKWMNLCPLYLLYNPERECGLKLLLLKGAGHHSQHILSELGARSA